ncbi:iron ABC transporter permease [Sphingomonas sp.]|uniref:FecCD family ABC transporter permease n=1 Tax=Sphingomonas sp. TaxID=28214 RepID=UPI0025D727D5|nr:iron ABC transporter permease [Sphingomonas sp.]
MKGAGALVGLALAAIAAAHLFLPLGPVLALHRSDPATAELLLTQLRLPSTLLALGYGAVLGMSGAALQAVFANPLASPDITGGSSGAALGAVLAAYWFEVSGPIALAACGGAGALVALALLLTLAGRNAAGATLLLAGLAISLAAGAATSLVLALAPSPFAFYDSFEWLMGSLVDRSLPQAATALVPAAFCCLLLLARSRALDLMALGEDVLASLGYRPRRIAIEVVALSAIAVGACVSVCGAIGFVGLIAPYAGRLVTRGHPGRALLPSAAIGGALLLLADLAVRFGPAGRTIPVGVLTTVAGTPLFVWIVVRMRARVAA